MIQPLIIFYVLWRTGMLKWMLRGGLVLFVILMILGGGAHAAEPCHDFLFIDAITSVATESCGTNFMDDVGVVAIVRAAAARNCTADSAVKTAFTEAEKSWNANVANLGHAGACEKMRRSMRILNADPER